MEKTEGERTSYRCCSCRGTTSWSICSPASPVGLDWKGKPPVSSWRERRSGCRSLGYHRRRYRREPSCRWPCCWCWSGRTNRSRWRYILSPPQLHLLAVDIPAGGHPSSVRSRGSSWATRSCWWLTLVRRLLATAEARTCSDGGHLSRKSTENYVNVFSPYVLNRIIAVHRDISVTHFNSFSINYLHIDTAWRNKRVLDTNRT